jgi:uncharacterized protein
MYWRDEDPGLPVKFGPCSNGEYNPVPLSPVVREAIRRARAECDRNARRMGLSRRQFMLSICGAATTFLVLEACSRESSRESGKEPGGRFNVPPEAGTDPDAAKAALAGEEFIFDIQSHFLEYRLNSAARNGPFFTNVSPLFPQAKCGEADPHDCFSMAHFFDLMFVRSDTDMVVLSALPLQPEEKEVLSPDVMDETRRVALALCRNERVLLHAAAYPNVGPLKANLEAMEEAVERHGIVAWKLYTHYPDFYNKSGTGWRLDDGDTAAPKVGEAFIDKAVELGKPVVAVHKGFSFGNPYASPVDIGPAAKAHPEVSFVVYHSGYEAQHVEGPYQEKGPAEGIDRLIRSMQDAGIGPNANVYAELGSTWWNVMKSPTEAAHVLGKLLKYVGENNVVWGTDSIFYGTPQDQIQALRALEITEELQERHGYPALTQQVKAKILGLNGARVYGVEPVRTRCDFTRDQLERIRRDLPGDQKTLGPSTPAQLAAFVDAHQGWP